MPSPFAALAHNPSRVQQLLADSGANVEAVSLSWCRLSPRLPQRAALQLRIGNECIPAALLQFTPARALEILAKWSRMRPRETVLGAGVRALAEPGLLMFLWPNDRKLRGARLLADKDRLKRALRDAGELVPEGFRVRGRALDVTVMRYKPELRAVARLDLSLKHDLSGEKRERHVFMRVFPDGRGAAIDALQRGLRQADPSLPMPEPLGTLARGQIQLESGLAGQPLSTEQALQHADALIATIQRLHAAQVQQGAAPQDRRRDISDIARLAPELALIARDVQRRLNQQDFSGTPGFVHGDLHLYQCLEHAGRISLIDFERAAHGLVEEDWGSLLAHIRLAHLEARESGAAALHERISRRSGAGALVQLRFEARAVAQLALGPLRRATPNAVELAEQRLRTAAQLLGLFRAPRRRSAELPLLAGIRIEKLHPRPSQLWPGVFRADGLVRHGVLHLEDNNITLADPADDPLTHGAKLLAWRPRSRAVLLRSTAEGPCIVKRFAGSKAILARQRHEAALALRTQRPAFPHIARILPSENENELTTEFVSGRSLHDHLLERSEQKVLAAVAQALAHWHAAPAPDLPHTRPLSFETLLEVFRRFHPALLRDAEALAAERGPIEPERRALVHADLHDRNILLNNSRVSLIDLDMVQAGDPDADMGNLAAHCLLRALQRGDNAECGLVLARDLVRQWRNAGGASHEGEADAAARTCFRLAALYSVRRRWRYLAPLLLQLSADPALFEP